MVCGVHIVRGCSDVVLVGVVCGVHIVRGCSDVVLVGMVCGVHIVGGCSDVVLVGVVCGVSPEEERISLSFRTSRLPPEFGNLQLVMPA